MTQTRSRGGGDKSLTRHQKPYQLVIELARAEAAGDPYAFQFTEQTYTIREEGGGYESAVFPWSSEILEDLDRIQQPRPDRAAMQRMGDRLRAFLSTAAFRGRGALIDEALEQGRGVHVTFRSAAAELYALPWELVTRRATGQHFGEIDNLLIRYEWPGAKAKAPSPDPPHAGGRVLFAWSSAGGAVPAAEHLDAIRSSARRGFYPFDEDRDVLAHASLRSLKAALGKGDRPCVLHLLCHGGKTASDTPLFGLVLDGSGEGEPSDVIDAGALRQALEPFASSLRLVVLAACQGADGGAIGNHLGSVAQALHRVGIEAVVASRYPLSVEGSISLTRAFYDELLVGLGSLEAAFLAARKSLADRPERLDWAALQLMCGEPIGLDHRPIVVRPYRGLEAFRPEDRRLFFGRRSQVDRLLTVLRGGQRLLALLGASGSGKSSLVMAGVIPEVQAGALEGLSRAPDPSRAAPARAFRLSLMRSGAKPCAALADALAALELPEDQALSRREVLSRTHAPGSNEEVKIEQRLRDSPKALAEIAEATLGHLPGKPRLLLVVDQFEEVFTQVEDRADAAAFVANILHATEGPGEAVWVILTLRADFLSYCLDFDLALSNRLRDTMEIALPMSEAELRETIERPAEMLGLEFEAGLVDALLEGAHQDAAPKTAGAGLSKANLPLIQFALDALWERRRDGVMTFDAWREIGGIHGALTRKAEKMLEDSEGDDERALVKAIFGQLVQVGEGTADTRRYASRAELSALAPGKIEPILDRWIKARLLTADEDEVWVAHEALIREWRTWRTWIEESREALRVRQEVEHEAFRWSKGGCHEEDLLRGGRLRRAIELAEAKLLPISPDERRFLKASAEREEAERAKELELQKEKARRSKKVAMASIGAVVAMSGLSLWAVVEKQEAHSAKAAAEKATEAAQKAHKETTAQRQISAAQELILRSQPAFASKLLATAVEARQADEFYDVAVAILKSSMPWRTLTGHSSALTHVAVSPDGKLIVTTSRDKTARLWGIDGVARSVMGGHMDEVVWVSWSPDSKSFVTASRDGTARVHPVEGSAKPIVLRGHSDALTCVAWSPKGDRIATASEDATARVFQADGSGEAAVFKGHKGPITDVAWSPSGDRIALSSTDETVSVHRADGTGKAIVLKGHTAGVTKVAWRPDGRYIATGSKDQDARVFRADGAGKSIPLVKHSNTVMWLAWSPKGDVLVTASADSTAGIWRAVTGAGGDIVEVKDQGSFTKHATSVTMAEWRPTGDAIVTTSADGKAMVWPVADPERALVLLGHTGPVVAAAWQPSGRGLVTASADGDAKLWLEKRFTDAISLPKKSDPPEAVVKQLEEATAECLPAEERHLHLGVPEAVAKVGYEVCEEPYRRAAVPAASSKSH